MKQAPTDYEYDVFISYRRNSIVQQWVHESEFFHELLVSYLAMELERPIVVFRDTLCLKHGDNYPREIERALRCSRCLLPIGTGDYFASTWCSTEFETFKSRAALAGGADLIVPVQWHDWEPPPPPVGTILFADFREVAWLGAKQDATLKVPFQRIMRTFCQILASKIRDAPAFDPSWTVVMPTLDEVRPPKIGRPRAARQPADGASVGLAGV
jgi:TIR domain